MHFIEMLSSQSMTENYMRKLYSQLCFRLEFQTIHKKEPSKQIKQNDSNCEIKADISLKSKMLLKTIKLYLIKRCNCMNSKPSTLNLE